MSTLETKTKLTPTLRFPEFSGEWEVKKLGEFSDVSKLAGYEFTKHIVYSEIGTLIGLRGLNIKNNKLDLSDVKYVDKSELRKLSRSKLYVDDLMFTYVGTIGEVALIPENNRFYLAPNVARIRVNQNLVDAKYINQYFYNNEFRKKEVFVRIATSSQPALSMANIRLFKFNLPSKAEQQKIASFLTTVDHWIENLKKQKKAQEKYKKGMMQKIFSQELRFKDENGDDYPEWEEKRLGEILKEVNEKTTENNQYEVLSSTMKGIFLQKDYFNREIASSDNTGYKVLRKKQLVFSPQNLWLGNINICNNFEIGIVSPSYKIFSFRKDVALVDYYNYFIKQPRMLFEYEISSEQGASVVRRNLDMNLFFKIKILNPSLPEQSKIGSFLKSIDDLINLTNQRITLAEEWKKGLMQRMFV